MMRKISRYDIVILLVLIFFISLIFLIIGIKKKEDKLIGISSLVGSVALGIAGINFLLPSVVWNNEIEDLERVKFCKKGEGDEEGFEVYRGDFPIMVDGISIEGIRYKAVNGTDIYITKEGEVKHYGYLSEKINKYLGGGWEPSSIQDRPEWELPEECKCS